MAERATKDRRMKSAVIELWQFTTQTKNRESEEMAQTKPDSSANWHHKRCRIQPNRKLPSNILNQAQTAICQLRLNTKTGYPSWLSARLSLAG